MRVIWLLGGQVSDKVSLEEAFARPQFGANYLVRQAQSIDEIPDEHLREPGVVVLVDSFHPKWPGFEALRQLRQKAFHGPVFLFGEPAPESALEPFKHLALSGYFPPFERADYYFASGLIHHYLNFDGRLDLSAFLAPTGRASDETIRNLTDFNLFVKKMNSFVSRFGVDATQLKKVLMGLSLAHVKTGSGHAGIEEPFTISFGMDPEKIILSATSFSKGVAPKAVLEEFCSSLATLKSVTSLQSSIFPEIHHVSRAAENLVIFGGSARSASEQMDPMMLMTTLSFPGKGGASAGPVYSFIFAHVKESAELSEEVARIEKASAVSAGAEVGASAAQPAVETAPVVEEVAEESIAPAGTIEAVNIDKILTDPTIEGDAPAELSAEGGEAEAQLGPMGSELPGISAEEAAEAVQQLVQLKEITQIMGQDIRRLMKERREPTTDRELRDAYVQLEEKLKLLTVERNRAILELEKSEKALADLKKQIESAGSTPPASAA